MKAIIISLILILPCYTWAHLGNISGQIVEKETGKPITGSTVSIIGLPLSKLTDEFGHFKFQNLAAKKHQIKCSNIGFKTLIMTVNVANDETTIINFRLEPSTIDLNEIVITTPKTTNQQLIGSIDTNLRPINNTQDLLRMVPGLFIGQHAGGGKAEQIFLRGFDIDHGTDIHISSDGMPVNMPSHAHGQGYADTHFIIPELVQQVKFNKGPYYAAKGNFATAGSVELNTKTTIDKSQIKLEIGQFNSKRALSIINLLGQTGNINNQSAYIAADYNHSDGYFENPQDFYRANIFGKFHGHIDKNTVLTASLSSFYSKWNASGQIPERSVKNGSIGFFGAIDPNEGGQTNRTNINFQTVTNTAKNRIIKNQLYHSNYHFKLFSNFTFFLNDATNGDQIKQVESRNLVGYNGSITSSKLFGKKVIVSTIGINIRNDATQNTELSHTKNRTTALHQIKFGDINELNTSIFGDFDIKFSDQLLVNFGIRHDFFIHKYLDKLLNNYQIANNILFSPKLNIIYTINNRSQIYINSGQGFHSNDTRVVVSKAGLKTLPAAIGTDIGLVIKAFQNLILNPALWYLGLEQEFVYVGDEGVVEPSGRTRRYGFDLSTRYQIGRKLHFDCDFNITKPRAVSETEGENYIPLAPKMSYTFGLSFSNKKGITSSIRGRYLGSRPANENGTLIAKGYFISDFNLNYNHQKYQLGLSIQNLLNTKWKETQFATTSQLKNENSPSEEIHFTPGTPFFAKINITFFF